MRNVKSVSEYIVDVDIRLERILPQFLAGQRSDFEKIKLALKSNDYQELMRLGHRMRGSCGGYGFHDLGRMAEELEKAAHVQDFPTLTELVKAMAQHLDSVKVRFQKMQ